MKKVPIIGITTYGRDADGDFHLPAAYVDAVRNAGGLPVLLAPGEKEVREVLELVDGLILAGGGDINPALYGGKRHPSIERTNEERDTFEMELARSLLSLEIPVLGVCRGMQILNIASGGTLIEHLPDRYGASVSHRGNNGEPLPHIVHLKEGSRLGAIIGSSEIAVMSLHHQAPGDVPEAWVITGRSVDDVVEAFESPDHPWMVAVLWHPELSEGEGDQKRLLRAFVAASADYKNKKQGSQHAAER